MVTDLKRHLRIIGVLYRFWFMRTLEFRVEVLSWSLLSVLWGFTGFFVAQLVFGQVNTIAGWNKDQVLILVAIQTIFDSLMWALVFPSILSFAETVREGKLDFYLTKPINPRFFLSVAKFEFDNYPRLVIMSLFLVYLLRSTSIIPSLTSIALFLILLAMGLFIFYCLFFAVATTSFWFIKIFNLEDLLQTFISAGRYPTYVFKGGLRIAFFFFLPLPFIATFPAQAILGKGGLNLIAAGLIMCATFLLASQWFWNFAVKRYSSASS